jgi:hypothetical protein
VTAHAVPELSEVALVLFDFFGVAPEFADVWQRRGEAQSPEALEEPSRDDVLAFRERLIEIAPQKVLATLGPYVVVMSHYLG